MAWEAQVRRNIRDAVNQASRKPFRWGGLEGYRQLEAIALALHDLPYEPETVYLRRLAQQVDRVVEKNRPLAEDLAEAQTWLTHIADCLRYPSSAFPAPARWGMRMTSDQIAADMDGWLDQFHPDLKRQPGQAALYQAWHRLWDTCGADLLPCYDIPGVPADNMKMEAMFGQLRRHQRRISGCKSTRPLRDFGQCQVLFDAPSEAELLLQLQQVSLADYQANRRRITEAETPRQQLRRFHQDPTTAIRQLVDQHAARRAELARDTRPSAADHTE